MSDRTAEAIEATAVATAVGTEATAVIEGIAEAIEAIVAERAVAPGR